MSTPTPEASGEPQSDARLAGLLEAAEYDTPITASHKRGFAAVIRAEQKRRAASMPAAVVEARCDICREACMPCCGLRRAVCECPAPAAQGADVAAKLKAVLAITAFNSGGYAQIEALVTDALAALDARLSPPQAGETYRPHASHQMRESGCRVCGVIVEDICSTQPCGYDGPKPVPPPPQGAPEPSNEPPQQADVCNRCGHLWANHGNLGCGHANCNCRRGIERSEKSIMFAPGELHTDPKLRESSQRRGQGAPEASVDLEQLAWKTAQSIMNDLDIDSEMETRSVADFILAALQRARETGAATA